MVRFEPVESRRSITGHLLWFGMWLGVTLVALWLTPNEAGHGTHRQLGFPPCPSVLMFDKPCPGCGLTTSFTASVHGQLGAALKAHPLGPAMYGLLSLSAFACLYGFWARKRFVTTSAQFNWALGAAVAVFLIYGVIRFSTTSSYSVASDYAPVFPDLQMGRTAKGD
jgi:hypothetical protein